jgi:hypothetical protein
MKQTIRERAYVVSERTAGKAREELRSDLVMGCSRW